jgi:hypothetical protein
MDEEGKQQRSRVGPALNHVPLEVFGDGFDQVAGGIAGAAHFGGQLGVQPVEVGAGPSNSGILQSYCHVYSLSDIRCAGTVFRLHGIDITLVGNA